ncbi:MAG: hypothetical protein H0W08_00455 [Acidobacteria bacterium]|nr:hypothetical protein [Acidobacteriota bacterium]
MSWLRRVANVFRRSRLDGEIDEELLFAVIFGGGRLPSARDPGSPIRGFSAGPPKTGPPKKR